ncbi:MAG: GMP/IMP nucleotidase [Chromatiales bacterium]|nr:GMP/IMP nucleotidase [Chromatiales bacterium]
MLDWSRIDSVFLDMDGTLLDLNFDNHFWQEHVPLRYGERNGLSVQQAKDELFPRFRSKEGTIDWYCLDFWTEELGLDIALLKQEVEHLIDVHPFVVQFLDAVRNARKRVVLVTNAHHKSLELKMDRTRLGGHFDALINSHQFGIPKEQVVFWDRLQALEPFDRQRTLLVDDSLSVLRSARSYGIANLRAVYRPDSQQGIRDVADFEAIHSFRDLIP